MVIFPDSSRTSTVPSVRLFESMGLTSLAAFFRRLPTFLEQTDLCALAVLSVHLDAVHERLHQETAPAARLVEVLGERRVGDVVGIESLAPVPDRHLETVVVEGEGDAHALLRIESIAVLDRVDGRLADRESQIQDLVRAEADHRSDLI